MHCAEPLPSISLNLADKCDKPKNKWLSQFDWLNQSDFAPVKLSTYQHNFPMKQPTDFGFRHCWRWQRIGTEKADLLKAVNEWLEKSPNLFPNQYAFSSF
ncbi:hypothetical protein CK209_17625 [Vibrio anguillarum]|nr:hypothetical protein CKX99_17710 [Vibrio anguillarum]AUB99337.1 hypothetical protein CK209_17625 [Vibrio anguillarum]